MVNVPLKPYPAYKPAGIPWLQQLPEHWEVVRMGALLQERGETNEGQKEQHVLSLLRKRGVIPYDEKGRIGNKKSEDITRYKIVRPDDIVVNSMNVIIGSVGISKYTGCLSPVYYVLKTRSNRDDAFYLNYVFQIEQFQKSLIGIGNGILAHRMRIAMEKFKCELFPRPPIEEQYLIVRYLHALDAKVNRYIRTKRKLIAALQEQKQVIIQHAVTRGLDPKVKLKPSGVEWLGEVPETWEVRRLASVASFQSGKAHEHFIEPNGKYVCVNARFVSSEGESRKYCTQSFCTAVKGDVLMVMSDLPNGRALARSYLVEDDALYAVNQRVCRLRAFAMNPKFLAYAANRNPGLMRHNDGFNQTHLSNSDYKTLPIVVPPRPEQDEIVRVVERQVAQIDVSFKAIERELRILNEYHTRLIADVVTGAVDVRAAAKAMATEVEEVLEEEPLSMAAEGEAEYGADTDL